MKKILFVDDEPNVLAAFQRQLRKQFNVETALGPIEGLAVLQNHRDYAVVVADMRMPEMNGVEFLAKVKEMAPDIVRMMLTGNADQSTAIDAINQGNIFRFLSKPCPSEALIGALEAGLRQHQLVMAERELLENTLSGSLRVLGEILAMVEPKSYLHNEGLRNNIEAIAKYLRVGQPWELEVAAMLAHIGYVTIPPEVMLKMRIGHTLTGREQALFRNIPAIGSNLLSQIPRLEEVAKTILYQNKRFDGSGFPEDGVKGTAIPLGSRVLRVLFDLADAEGQNMSRSRALNLLRGRAGWYDPDVLDAVVTCLESQAQGDTSMLHRPPLTISFSNLQIGHVLASDIRTMDGILIVSTGNEITPPLMQRLRNFSSLSGIKEPILVEAT